MHAASCTGSLTSITQAQPNCRSQPHHMHLSILHPLFPPPSLFGPISTSTPSISIILNSHHRSTRACRSSSQAGSRHTHGESTAKRRLRVACGEPAPCASRTCLVRRGNNGSRLQNQQRGNACRERMSVTWCSNFDVLLFAHSLVLLIV